jgi:hypothetical protein
MKDSTKRFKALFEENETAFKALLNSNTFGTDLNVPFLIKQKIKDAGIDNFFYQAMENDILKGNFSVIYLDDRMVGEDKKRLKLKKELNQIREQCAKMKNSGKDTFEILFEK